MVGVEFPGCAFQIKTVVSDIKLPRERRPGELKLHNKKLYISSNKIVLLMHLSTSSKASLTRGFL
jgi:hypothetical protein